MTSNSAWGTDVTISLPVPPNPEEPLRAAGTGFAYTRFGIAHNITSSDAETYLFPTFLPIDAPERE